jgi:uncharacterized protein YcbK (DUF882 family)
MNLGRLACGAVAALCVFSGTPALSGHVPERLSLNLHNVNTHEDLRITFKVDGVYDRAALEKLNWFFRDWRKKRATKMDPKVFELLARVYKTSGATQPVFVHCGFRSAETNAMLRRVSFGVARESQHIQGKAIDFHIPGVTIKRLREIALKFQSGGVGYYPTSGMPFVHIDVARVRYWPRASRAYLASLFPDGKTTLIPSDGKPMPGYAEALAETKGNTAVPPRDEGMLAVIGDISQFRVAATVKHGSVKVRMASVTAPVPASRPAVAARAGVPERELAFLGSGRDADPALPFRDFERPPVARVLPVVRKTAPRVETMVVEMKTVKVVKTGRFPPKAAPAFD